MSIRIGHRDVGPEHPVFFIADIASNHGGDLAVAKDLIRACADSGVDAVKMQNFTAATIVSDYGFRTLAGVETHQSAWEQSVFDSYDAASIPLSWTEELKSLCDDLGLAYFTSPYSPELVDAVAPHVSAFKLGSGDITWHEEIAAMGAHGKPIVMATGASNMGEVEAAMEVALASKSDVLLMQCNTEYTAAVDESDDDRLARFGHINLRVLGTFAERWPGVPLGLSDHTHGPMTVLGAVGLFDCCAVEKHFTFDNTLTGQDHAFSMTPAGWLEMAEQTRDLKAAIAEAGATDFDDRLAIVESFVDSPEELALALGNGVKRLEANETNTVIVQRRALRTTREIPAGVVLEAADLFPLRPCPSDGFAPHEIGELIGRTTTSDLPAGAHVTANHLSS